MSYPAWVTSTAYSVGDYVSQGGSTYICKSAHTSGTWDTDFAAGKWGIAYESLTPAQQAVVRLIDATIRDLHETLMQAHRLEQSAAAQWAQNASLFLTTMYPAEPLPIPGNASACATANNTNDLNNSRLEAETRIAAQVALRTTFRRMIGADRCPELGV
jgi:hypothetical protein